MYIHIKHLHHIKILCNSECVPFSVGVSELWNEGARERVVLKAVCIKTVNGKESKEVKVLCCSCTECLCV